MIADLKIRKITDQDFANWDKYVDSHVQGSFFHLTGWIEIARSVFGHKHHYLVAESNHGIVGVLPLIEQKSLIFGHALVSTPFCVYGGVVADNDEIRIALEQQAYQLGCSLKVDYVELRDKQEYSIEGPWLSHCHHSTFSCEIEETPEQILTSVKRKQRAVIRHSLKNDLTWSNSDDPKLCYDIYAESVRNLGTPVFSQKLFTTLKSVFSDRCETLIIRDDVGQAVSSVLSFYYKDTVLPYYGGGNRQARDLKSNDYMYYQLMCIAREKGFTSFDFGRSKNDSGSYKYKKHWGMQEDKLHYRIALVQSKERPNLSPNNPKYKLFINLWQKMPLQLSRIVGPMLSKYLG
ncbi:FemAB family PEP-CTERM system-associated protein [Vibrio sp. TH_r3]|uniref:FemAB family XrtA/PEP-CTERM system-associated protein n=1 Tax=Vibrio sp. TH_r3 TaxID=3082084 RepID=UPI0029555A82|nr:FemAB family XrtA/PEP-CTERM system-associated protein [Vibrio sp. TH_r3]MDV7102896.1 FemAB family PEP-CTERM system-associated protein [Vibrio sp. TH_r3]